MDNFVKIFEVHQTVVRYTLRKYVCVFSTHISWSNSSTCEGVESNLSAIYLNTFRLETN